jgi:hypothetical protein
VRDPAADGCDTSERNRELKELLLARALLACGDHQGRAQQVLSAYSQDLHGSLRAPCASAAGGRAEQT